ncbi:MAG: hypothetical protein ACREPU_12325 [Rhodanobacteraceae bacterium]
MTLHNASWQPAENARSTTLHFPMNAQGNLAAGFARTSARIAGKPVGLLLDTGATGYPTPATVAAEGGKANVRARLQGSDTSRPLTPAIVPRPHPGNRIADAQPEAGLTNGTFATLVDRP